MRRSRSASGSAARSRMAAELRHKDAWRSAGPARDAAARRAPSRRAQRLRAAPVAPVRRAGTRLPGLVGRPARRSAATSPVHGASRTVPGRRNSSHGARAAAAAALSLPASGPSTHQEIAAGDVGDGRGVVVRAAVGHQHFGDQTGRRARHQRGQRRHQRAFRIPRRDDDAQHVAAARAVSLDHRCPQAAIGPCWQRLPRLVYGADHE